MAITNPLKHPKRSAFGSRSFEVPIDLLPDAVQLPEVVEDGAKESGAAIDLGVDLLLGVLNGEVAGGGMNVAGKDAAGDVGGHGDRLHRR
jgi:hypothetical protein